MQNVFTLVTGASGGIGEAIAVELARRGHRLIISARSLAKLKTLEAQLRNFGSPEVVVIAGDLAQPAGARDLYQAIQDQRLEVSTLINNAGVGDFVEFAHQDWSRIQGMIQLNVTALTELTHLFLPSMLEAKNGRILNVASTAAFQPGPGMGVYYATKAYVLHLTEALAVELDGSGVLVQALCPGPTQSGFQSTAKMELSALFQNTRIPTSESVAQFAVQRLGNNQVILIPGFLNQLMAGSVGFLPRSAVRHSVGWIQRTIKKK